MGLGGCARLQSEKDKKEAEQSGVVQRLRAPAFDKSDAERTEVVSGVAEVYRVGEMIVERVKDRLCVFADKNAPILNFRNDLYADSLRQMRERGVAVQILTEITKENESYCRKMVSEFGIDLRHSDDAILGYFLIADGREFLASSQIDLSILTRRALYSNSEDLARQYQAMFDSQWSKSLGAEQRLRELELGITKYRTKIIRDEKENLREVKRMLVSSEKYYCISGDQTDFAFAEENLFNEIKSVLDKRKAGSHQGLRWVGIIDASCVDSAKRWLELGADIRHISELPVGSFGLSEKEMGATASLSGGGFVRYNTLFSTDPMYVEHYLRVFEGMWKSSIDARVRIREIEQGIQNESVSVIGNPEETRRIFLEMLESAEKEIMVIFPTENACLRERRFGAEEIWERKADSNRVKVRLMGPVDPRYAKPGVEVLRTSFSAIRLSGTIVIVDNRFSLAIELEDDSQDDFVNAVGLATYSTSEATVRIHSSFFEALWHEAELKERAERNKREAELLQDILSHDIRNFNQAARLNAELLEDDVTDSLSKRLLGSLINSIDGSTALVDRAAKIGRILEAGSDVPLQPVDVGATIAQSMSIVKKSWPNKKIEFRAEGENDMGSIFADEMIGEIFVNIFSNSVKYTESTEVRIDLKARLEGDFLRLSIADFGRGIPPDQKRGLFSRYVKNAHGSGLGLSIVHALVVGRYRGKIAVKDRVDGDHTEGTVVELWFPEFRPESRKNSK